MNRVDPMVAIAKSNAGIAKSKHPDIEVQKVCDFILALNDSGDCPRCIKLRSKRTASQRKWRLKSQKLMREVRHHLRVIKKATGR